MSESAADQDASVLGKRVHDGSPQKPEDEVTPGPAEDDDDDDDIGPMPMPADASSKGGSRKKRKGSFVAIHPRGVVYHDSLVLPHERLYLEHLPAADRYFKSFMHRDAINFNITTKCVFYRRWTPLLTRRR
jgi:peptidylprolyl isomerase domain and WD repeat-containing protein 1